MYIGITELMANYGHQLFDVADNPKVNQFTALGSAVYWLYCLAESTYLCRRKIERFILGCMNFQSDIVFPICSSPWFQNDTRGSSRWWVAVIQRCGTKRCRTLPPGVSCQEWPPTVYPTLNSCTVFTVHRYFGSKSANVTSSHPHHNHIRQLSPRCHTPLAPLSIVLGTWIH